MNYNCRLLTYPTGQQVTCYSKSIGRGKDAELNENFKKSYQNKDRDEKGEQHSNTVSLKRTKNNIYKIARSNEWEWFITFTFDRTKTDSSDYDLVVDRLTSFLRNLGQRKCPGIKYLIVPELHADGEHYHFHGLLANCNGLQFQYSGHDDKKGNPIFNIINWKWGFTTATRVEDTDKVSGYITKYITKECVDLLKNKKRYYASRNVDRPDEDLLVFDEEDFLDMYGENIQYCKSVTVKEAHMRVNYYEIDY